MNEKTLPLPQNTVERMGPSLHKLALQRISSTLWRELGSTALLLLGVSVTVFAVLYAAPGSPFKSPELVVENGGIAPSAFSQYWQWLVAIAHGDFGNSIRSGLPVLPELLTVTANTLQLTLAAMLVALIPAFPIAWFSAMRPHAKIAWPLILSLYISSSLPLFWVAYLLIYVSTNYFDYFPLASTFGVSDGGMDLAQFLLPVFVLGIAGGMSSEAMRFLRLEIARVMAEEYIRTARAKGAPVWRHAFKEAALLPLVEIVTAKVPFMLSGAIIVEQVFNWPGMGRMAWQAAQDRDFPVIMGVAIAAAVLVRLGSFVHKTIYVIVNPRASHE